MPGGHALRSRGRGPQAPRTGESAASTQTVLAGALPPRNVSLLTTPGSTRWESQPGKETGDSTALATASEKLAQAPLSRSHSRVQEGAGGHHSSPLRAGPSGSKHIPGLHGSSASCCQEVTGMQDSRSMRAHRRLRDRAAEEPESQRVRCSATAAESPRRPRATQCRHLT